MSRDAGFEIDGNECYDEIGAAKTAKDGESEFRIPGGGDQLLKPEIAQA